MQGKRAISLSMVLVLCLTGCASIVGKNLFPVTINSNPDGVNILIQDEKGKKVFSGVTPTTVTLTSGESYFHAKSYNVTFSKPGYAEQYATIKSTLSGWYWGNILFGGFIGMLIVDPITGNMWKLPTDLTANLTQQKTAMNNSSAVLKIVTIDQISDDMRRHLIRLN